MALPLFYAIYCLEAGVFFTIVPWTRLWTVNPLLHTTFAVSVWADNPFVRGFISGIGLIHLVLGARELFALVRKRGYRRP